MFRTFEISDPRFEWEGLRCVTVKSAALRGRGDITLWVPPDRKPVGTVVLLHGVYGSHWAWAMKGGAHRTAARLVASGVIPPWVLAMPSDGLWGDGSGYLALATQDFERWVAEDVPAAVAHAVPAMAPNAPCFIAGLSMGGFGALRLAACHSDRFAAASGHSAVTHLRQLRPFVDESLETCGAPADAWDLLGTILKRRGSLPPIRFDCGTEDALLDANRELHAALTAAGIPHDYEEFPGGHDWLYWERHLERTLRFFAAGVRP